MNNTQVEYFERYIDNSFVEINLQPHLLTLRRGLVGKPCLVINISPDCRDIELGARIAKNELMAKGYKPKSRLVSNIDGPVAEFVWADKLCNSTDNTRLVELATQWSTNEACNIVRFNDGLYFDGDLDIEWMVDSGLANGLLIEGDVYVNGLFSQETNCYPNGILINGNVSAKNIIHGASHLTINGNVHVDQTVYGYDTEGSLEIRGTVYAEAFVSADHDMGAEHWHCFAKLADDQHDPSWIDPCLLEKDIQLDLTKVKSFVKDRRSLLREGIKYTRSKIA